MDSVFNFTRTNLPLAARLERMSMPVPESGCWAWVARIDRAGYGLLWVNNKCVLAHRASFTLHRGPIPPGMCVCHRCDVRCCINPDHLFLGTVSDNRIDRLNKLRALAAGVEGAPFIRATRPHTNRDQYGLGVTKTRHGRWQAQRNYVPNKTKYLGTYPTREEALAAVARADKQHGR